MRVTRRWVPVALAIGAALAAPVSAQQARVVAHTVSVAEDGATLQLELTDGSVIAIAMAGGQLLVDGEVIGRYEQGAALHEAWRQTLSQAGRLNSEEVLVAVRSWDAEGEAEAEALFKAALEARLARLQVARADLEQVAAIREIAAATAAARVAEMQERLEGRLAGAGNVAIQLDDLGQLERIGELGDMGLHVENATVRLGDVTVPRGEVLDNDLIVLGGDVSVYGRITGNLVALNGDVILHNGGAVDGDLVTLNGDVTQAGGVVAGAIRSADAPRAPRVRARAVEVRERSFSARNGTTLASVFGMFVALASIGFGFTFFMPRQLDVVSDTVTNSFGRSFFAGLFAQPLLVPAALIVILGLVITVVGILLVPFAALAMALALGVAGVGGYLAVARSVGGSYLTRRMAQGHAVVATPYRSMLYGLAALLAIWLPAALLGWIPLVGNALALLAGIFTWAMLTAGFGAVILSRAGLRASFGPTGPRAALTDEHYWPGDPGVPALRRAPHRDR